MSSIAVKTNQIGLSKNEYRGANSTLCSGCGHDSITSHIITSYYELGIDPYTVAKMSGIGCSSKTPAYFMSKAHGFNSVHGRMPSVVTGAKMANKHINIVAVSGDGDTGNIGLGQFMHIVRRNVDMLYIIENNGVYGLTKGQFSATADTGSKLKHGTINEFTALDPCALAIELDCGYVVRSFAGDPKQLVPLMKGGISHKGLALMDIISPCVTFNNHLGSTKSYDYVKEHDIRLHEVNFIPSYEEISVDYEAGDIKDVTLHDGSHIRLKKLDRDFDPTNKLEVLQALEMARREHIILTGLLYTAADGKDLTGEVLNLVEQPLYALMEEDLRPSREVLSKIMSDFR